MATMTIYGKTLNVIYVDPLSSTNGDGSTPASPLWEMPKPFGIANSVYLLRRVSLAEAGSTVDIEMGFTSGLANICVMGMPKVGDMFYDIVPAEAKAAWDADVADYADIFVSGADGKAFYAGALCSYAVFSRLRFIIGGVTTFVTNTWTIYIDGSDSSTVVLLDNVVMQQHNYDEMTAVSTTDARTYLPFYATAVDSVVMNNCEFKIPSYTQLATGNGNHIYAIAIFASASVHLSSVTVRGMATPNLSPGTYGWVTIDGVRRLTVRDFVGTYVEARDGAASQFQAHAENLGMLFLYSVAHVDIDGVTITSRRIGSTTPTSTSGGMDLSNNPGAIYIFKDYGNGKPITGSIKNVNIDVSNLSTPITGLRIIGTGGIGESHGRLYVSNVTFTATQSTLASASAANAALLAAVIVTANGVELDNITAGFPNISSTVALVAAMRIGFPNATWLSTVKDTGIVVKNATLTGGSLDASSAVYVDVTSMTVAQNLANPIEVRGGTMVRIGTLTLPTGWTTTFSIATVGEAARLHVGSCDKVGLWTISTVHGWAIVENAEGITGNWQAYSSTTTSKRSATVSRTGGAANAIHVVTPATTTELCGAWSGQPLIAKPFEVTIPSTGRWLVRVYMAIKTYASMQIPHGRFQVFVEGASGASGTARRMTCSALDGWCLTDASVWNGDTVTAYVIVTPIVADRVEPLRVSLHFAPAFVTSALYYVDPKIEVVAG